MAGKRVVVQKTTPEQKPVSERRIFATLCYYYPRYSLAEARSLPYRDVRLLVNEAMRQEAARNYMLTQIAAAPHSEKGEAVQQLLSNFEERING